MIYCTLVKPQITANKPIIKGGYYRVCGSEVGFDCQLATVVKKNLFAF